MFWKTFLISFMLNNKKFTSLVFLDSNKLNKGLSEKIPRRLRSYSDDFDDDLEINKNKSFRFFKKKGYDNRFNDSENSDNLDIIFNITNFHTQYKLLKELEKNNTSTHVKLDLINNYNKNFPKPLTYNVFAGGLFNDWN